jgi:hypothetical protein
LIKHKYKAIITIIDDIKFSSKKEANHYYNLKLLKENGDIVFFLRQVPFHLPGNIKYVCDFMVFWKNGDVTVEDVKGYKTRLYTTKKKLVESLYPIKIKEI